MHEFSIFQLNTYVIGNAFTPSVMEEHQVTFLQLALGYFSAIFRPLGIRTALQFLVVHFFIDS